METTDEILERLKESRAAGKLLRRYKEAKRQQAAMERYRPSLLGVIGAVPGKYIWDDYYRYRAKMQEIRIPAEDANLLLEYIDGEEVISMVEVAIRERLETERRDEAEDLFINGRSTAEILAKYDISERTVRRLWKKGKRALEKEMALRIGCGRRLSTPLI